MKTLDFKVKIRSYCLFLTQLNCSFNTGKPNPYTGWDIDGDLKFPQIDS